jgi:predicted nucleic acid-binding protein
LTVILDASVVGKYLVPETDSDKARALVEDWDRGKTQFKSPEILAAEVASLLRKRVLRGLIPALVATELFLKFEDLRVPLEPVGDLAGTALALSLRYGHSVYDGLYAALAFRLRAELVTADDRLCRALRGSGVLVRPLTSWL